jgi:hypothetical protein
MCWPKQKAEFIEHWFVLPNTFKEMAVSHGSIEAWQCFILSIAPRKFRIAFAVVHMCPFADWTRPENSEEQWL